MFLPWNFGACFIGDLLQFRYCGDGSGMVVVSVISVVGVVDMISLCFGDTEWVGCGL
jgi:hypothetical protein